MLVAIVALVVAASGTAVAAQKLVGDSLIKKNSLSGNRLRNHTVTGSKIKLSSLGTVPSATHAATADTATNAATAGSAPVAKLIYVTTSFTVPGNGADTRFTANCPSGTDVTGGGATINDTVNGFFQGSYPAGKTGWTADYEDFGGGPTTAYAYAICAPAATTAP